MCRQGHASWEDDRDIIREGNEVPPSVAEDQGFGRLRNPKVNKSMGPDEQRHKLEQWKFQLLNEKRLLWRWSNSGMRIREVAGSLPGPRQLLWWDLSSVGGCVEDYWRTFPTCDWVVLNSRSYWAFSAFCPFVISTSCIMNTDLVNSVEKMAIYSIYFLQHHTFYSLEIRRVFLLS